LKVSGYIFQRPFLHLKTGSISRILTCSFLALFSFQYLSAQDTLKIVFDNDSLLNKSYKSRLFSTRSILDEIVLSEYRSIVSEGYFDSKLDTSFRSKTLFVSIEKGRKSKVYFSGVKGLIKDSSDVELNKIRSLSEEKLRQYENNGYPFASIIWKADYANDSLVLRMNTEPGAFFAFDSLIVKGEGKLPEKYIRRYLSFRKGDAYDESWVRDVEKRLSEIPFVRPLRGAEVLFRIQKADCYVYAAKKNANYFNGIIGIQPNETTGKTNITGDLEIKLFNLFNSGDESYLNWRKIQAQTQDLSAHLMLPFLAGLPIGTEGKLNIFRRDSSFTNLKTSLALIHLMGGYNRLRVFVEKTATNQLTTFSTAGNLANVNATLYGIGIRHDNLDYRFNPRKGFQIDFEIAAGKKETSKDSESSTLRGNFQQHRVEGDLGLYIPTFKRQTIFFNTRGAWLISPTIYTTEMYRIGGLKTIRGLDEESLFASAFLRGGLEYRYLLDQNSHVLLFVDQAWYERREPGYFVTDTPFGFGAGLSFETKAGIFLFNYALGQQFDNPILLRSGKVSFGFRNIF